MARAPTVLCDMMWYVNVCPVVGIWPGNGSWRDAAAAGHHILMRKCNDCQTLLGLEEDRETVVRNLWSDISRKDKFEFMHDFYIFEFAEQVNQE